LIGLVARRSDGSETGIGAEIIAAPEVGEVTRAVADTGKSIV